MTTHDPALVERVAKTLRDLDPNRSPSNPQWECYRSDARAVLDAITETHTIIQLPEDRRDDDGDGWLWPGIGDHPGLYVAITDPDRLVYDNESSFLPAEALEIAGQWAAAAARAAEADR